MNNKNKKEYQTPQITEILFGAEASLCINGSLIPLTEESDVFDWED